MPGVPGAEGLGLGERLDRQIRPAGQLRSVDSTGTFQMTFSGNVVNIIENENFNVIDGDATNGDRVRE